MIKRPSTANARLIASLAFLTLAPTTAVAAMITTCDATQSPGVVCSLPTPGGPGTATVLLPLLGTSVNYDFIGSPADTTQLFSYTITNDTGQTMTDLHLHLAFADIGAPFGPLGFNFPSPGTSAPFLPNASQSGTLDLDFVGPPVLLNLASTIVSFSINLPATNPGVNVNGDINVQITPTFGQVPEPSAILLLGAGLLALFVCRRRQNLSFC